MEIQSEKFLKITSKCEIELFKANNLKSRLDKKIEALEDELNTLKEKRGSLEIKMNGVRLYELVLSEVIK